MSTINENHTIYDSRDLEHDNPPIHPPTQPRESKFSKNEKKKHLDISSFYTSIPSGDKTGI